MLQGNPPNSESQMPWSLAPEKKNGRNGKRRSLSDSRSGKSRPEENECAR
jgi:hypothetical protein